MTLATSFGGAVCALAALACLSCQAIFGIDDSEPGGTGGTASTGHAGGGANGSSTDASTGATAGSGGSGACACASAIDAGWTGAFFKFTTKADEQFQCPGVAIDTTYWEGPPQGTYMCSACECSSPVNVSCGQNPLQCFTSASCMGASDGTFFPDGCSAVAGQASCGVGLSPVIGGSCSPTGGLPTSKPPGWQNAHHLCEAEPGSGTCAEGQCFAEAAGATSICVVGPADTPCPSGWDDDQVPAFGGAADDRGCTPCGCGTPEGTCDGGAYNIGGTFCDLGTKVTQGVCFSFNGTFYGNWLDGTSPGGSCQTTAVAAPTGEFIPTNPVTICCKTLSPIP